MATDDPNIDFIYLEYKADSFKNVAAGTGSRKDVFKFISP